MTGVNATYTTNIPFSSNNPSSDQPIMEQNTNSINSVLSVDHIAFNTSNNQGGYHSIIHLPPQISAPAAIAGIEQVFSMNVTPIANGASTDTQLFALTGANGLSQMTGYHPATEGYCWCNGLLFQWGFNSATSGGSFAGGTAVGTVSFKNRDGGSFTIDFPNNCFMVNATPTYFTATPPQAFFPAAIAIEQPFQKTKFNWSYNSTKTGVLFTGFSWFAIGN